MTGLWGWGVHLSPLLSAQCMKGVGIPRETSGDPVPGPFWAIRLDASRDPCPGACCTRLGSR